MPRLTVDLNTSEFARLLKLASQERRTPPDQLAFMVTLVLEVFDALPSSLFNDEQSDVMLRLLRDALAGEHGRALIEARQTICEKQRLIEKAGQLLLNPFVADSGGGPQSPLQLVGDALVTNVGTIPTAT